MRQVLLPWGLDGTDDPPEGEGAAQPAPAVGHLRLVLLGGNDDGDNLHRPAEHLSACRGLSFAARWHLWVLLGDLEVDHALCTAMGITTSHQ